MPFLQTKNVIPVGGKNDVPICMSVYVKHYYLYLYLCEYILDIYIYVIMFDHVSVFLYPYTIHKYICMDICMYVYIYICMYVHVSSYIYMDDIVWKLEPDLLLILFPMYKPNVSITGKGKEHVSLISSMLRQNCVCIYNLNKCQLPIQQKVASCNRTFCGC